MATASYKFRTTESTCHLTTALVAVSGYAKQADTLIDGVGAGTLTSKATAAEAASLEMLLTAKVKAIGSLLVAVQTLDGQNLKKAASLDQTALKVLAEKLKTGADTTLAQNLNAFFLKTTDGLNGAVKSSSIPSSSSSKDEVVDINTATKKALQAIGKLKGSIDKSTREKVWSASGASTAFWLKSGKSST